MLDLGQPMFDALLLAAEIEHMSRVSCRRAVRIPGRDALVDLDHLSKIKHARTDDEVRQEMA